MATVPNLDEVRGRAYDLRWLAPGYAGTGRLHPVTVTDADDLLALDRLIGVDVPAMADEIERLTQQLDALLQSISQRAPARPAEAVTSRA